MNSGNSILGSKIGHTRESVLLSVMASGPVQQFWLRKPSEIWLRHSNLIILIMHRLTTGNSRGSDEIRTNLPWIVELS